MDKSESRYKPQHIYHFQKIKELRNVFFFFFFFFFVVVVDVFLFLFFFCFFFFVLFYFLCNMPVTNTVGH